MDPLLMAVVAALLVLISIAGAFFVAVALWYLGTAIYDEIVIYKNEPRMTRGQKIQKEIEWEKYLDDLRRDYYNRPINIFRDGVHV